MATLPEAGVASGQSFALYLSDALGGTGNLNSWVQVQLETLGIGTLPATEWDGFSQDLFGALEDVTKDIENRRKTLDTYKHDRQVKAEAVVAVLVSAIRQCKIQYPQHSSDNAFFLSHSRAMDNIVSLPHTRMSMTPESLFQWLNSVQEMSDERASATFDLLLHDLAETRHTLVPQEQIIRSFAGLIEADKSILKKVVKDYKELAIEIYGQDPETAFHDMNALEIPDATETVSLLALKNIQRELERERKLRNEADRKLKTLSKLEKYRDDNIGRKQRALQKRRAAESRKRTKNEKKRRERRRSRR